jgi:hypothetical protein
LSTPDDDHIRNSIAIQADTDDGFAIAWAILKLADATASAGARIEAAIDWSTATRLRGPEHSAAPEAAKAIDAARRKAAV